MKKHAMDFIRRGLTACGLGPLVLAVLYLILYHKGMIVTLTVRQVCTGILSLSALAFVAGGMNFIYQLEKLPLMAAVFLHGLVLYGAYLATYLVNGWLKWGTAPIAVFSCIFVVGYLLIWAVIYTIIRRNTDRLNEMLKQKQQTL